MTPNYDRSAPIPINTVELPDEPQGKPFQTHEGIWLIVDDSHVRPATAFEVTMHQELDRLREIEKAVGRLYAALRAAPSEASGLNLTPKQAREVIQHMQAILDEGPR